ncbi:MAG TPA: hypothetical protein PL044_08290 [Clostridiales bacterium]|nr:hypothetical protein [Clostridiales bacterium]HQH62855.1 hypothetical protein [Clostridiales bacterium]HQK73750.1 hypothetical protein [Clostridiales bacterium]
MKETAGRIVAVPLTPERAEDRLASFGQKKELRLPGSFCAVV